MRASPDWGLEKPIRWRMVVLFPAPLGPKTENLAFMYSKGNVVDTTPVSVILGKAFDFNFLQVNRSYYNKFGQENRAASSAFPPSRA